MVDNNSSRKDFNPKHRIVGAIVLVSLAVIFVPMLLDKHDAPPVSAAVAQLTQIPPQTQEMVADVAPVSAPSAAPVEAPAPAIKTPPETTTTAPVKPAPMPAVQALPAKRVAPPPAAHAIPASVHSGGKGWFVQVGTFSQSRNAEQIARKLKAHGYPVKLEHVSLAEGRALRVRVGPYERKDQARTAQSDIQRKVGVHGDVRAE